MRHQQGLVQSIRMSLHHPRPPPPLIPTLPWKPSCSHTSVPPIPPTVATLTHSQLPATLQPACSDISSPQPPPTTQQHQQLLNNIITKLQQQQFLQCLPASPLPLSPNCHPHTSTPYHHHPHLWPQSHLKVTGQLQNTLQTHAWLTSTQPHPKQFLRTSV